MIYLDYNASTPVDQRVADEVFAVQGVFANPGSVHHGAGRAAAEIIEESRNRVSGLFGRLPQDVIFTSGATEAAVLGLLGLMIGDSGRPNVVVGATEHKAVVAAAELGAKLAGGEVRVAPVDEQGVVDVDSLERLTDSSIAAVVVMAANNETGVLSPVGEVAKIAERAGALHVIDATQLIGKGPVRELSDFGDFIFFSSHKIYGPKGAGAFIASRQVQKMIVPIAPGGGQERGLRGGTPNTPAIVGFGLACELAMKEQASDMVRIGRLAETFLQEIMGRLEGVRLNGGLAERVSNTLNIRFEGADAEEVMALMPGVLVSSGSACQSATPTASHVLTAMGLSAHEASESIRISLGRPTTEGEVLKAATQIVSAVTRVRAMV